MKNRWRHRQMDGVIDELQLHYIGSAESEDSYHTRSEEIEGTPTTPLSSHHTASYPRTCRRWTRSRPLTSARRCRCVVFVVRGVSVCFSTGHMLSVVRALRECWSRRSLDDGRPPPPLPPSVSCLPRGASGREKSRQRQTSHTPRNPSTSRLSIARPHMSSSNSRIPVPARHPSSSSSSPSSPSLPLYDPHAAQHADTPTKMSSLSGSSYRNSPVPNNNDATDTRKRQSKRDEVGRQRNGRYSATLQTLTNLLHPRCRQSAKRSKQTSIAKQANRPRPPVEDSQLHAAVAAQQP